MSDRIGSDVERFKKIVRNKVRDNLKDFIGEDHIVGSQGGKLVRIPIKYINQPRFTFGGKQQGGTGQGDGDEGDPTNGPGKKGKGQGKEAGEDGGEHELMAEFTADELASILKESLQLPDLEPRGTGKVNSEKNRYNGITNVGNEALRHNRRSFKQALVRGISTGAYNPNDPQVIIQKNDKRYRSATPIDEPHVDCLIVFASDISGSMGEKERHLVKSQSFWIELLLKQTYKNVQVLYMTFDTEAHIVERDEFYRLSSGGGTRISSAITLMNDLVRPGGKYPFSETNSYLYLSSDGDNYGTDNDKCISLLHEDILPNCNQFCYTQVKSAGGSGEFMGVMESQFVNHPKTALTHIENTEDIMNSIRTIFGGKTQ